MAIIPLRTDAYRRHNRMQVYQLFQPAEPTAIAEPRQRNVLIVDDDALVRETLQFVLEDNGYAVHATASGADALQILEQRPVDIVLGIL
jgi:Response regulator containing CheY-like receiver, AAA-type ATPase, and DNA-binding domains